MMRIFNYGRTDEPDDSQLRSIPIALRGELVSNGCDELKNSKGEFGRSADNPIPVNGPEGELKYLGMLIPKVLFHRLGSVQSKAHNRVTDVYEVVTLDGVAWDILYFDMLHPRRSKKSPARFAMDNYSEVRHNPLVVLGTNLFDETFPHGMPEIIQKRIGGSLGETIHSKVSRMTIMQGDSRRPKNQLQSVKTLMGQLEGQLPRERPAIVRNADNYEVVQDLWESCRKYTAEWFMKFDLAMSELHHPIQGNARVRIALEMMIVSLWCGSKIFVPNKEISDSLRFKYVASDTSGASAREAQITSRYEEYFDAWDDKAGARQHTFAMKVLSAFGMKEESSDIRAQMLVLEHVYKHMANILEIAKKHNMLTEDLSNNLARSGDYRRGSQSGASVDLAPTTGRGKPRASTWVRFALRMFVVGIILAVCAYLIWWTMYLGSSSREAISEQPDLADRAVSGADISVIGTKQSLGSKNTGIVQDTPGQAQPKKQPSRSVTEYTSTGKITRYEYD